MQVSEKKRIEACSFDTHHGSESLDISLRNSGSVPSWDDEDGLGFGESSSSGIGRDLEVCVLLKRERGGRSGENFGCSSGGGRTGSRGGGEGEELCELGAARMEIGKVKGGSKRDATRPKNWDSRGSSSAVLLDLLKLMSC